MSEQDKLTDEVVRDTFQWGATACACCAEYRDEDGVKFDAWLAEHDAKVRADAVREAAGYIEQTLRAGLVNRATVLGDLEAAAYRMENGMTARGNTRVTGIERKAGE